MGASYTEDAAAVARVVATPAALEAIAQLVGEVGPVMFFQSGGCCDGSMPMCFADGEFVIGGHDVRLGDVGGCPFYIDARQFQVWKHTQLIVDVGAGEPEGFSLAAGEDRHFIIRSKLFNADDQAALNGDGPSTRAPTSSGPSGPSDVTEPTTG